MRDLPLNFGLLKIRTVKVELLKTSSESVVEEGLVERHVPFNTLCFRIFIDGDGGYRKRQFTVTRLGASIRDYLFVICKTEVSPAPARYSVTKRRIKKSV